MTASSAASDPTFYYQTGAEPMVENSNPSREFTNLSVSFTLPSSPTGTAYELNGVTSTGDWIQMAFGDKWNVGFTLCSVPTYTIIFEDWNNSGHSETSGGGVVWWNSGLCSQPFTPSLGDTVGLSMSLNCPAGGTGSVCLTWSDITKGETATNIQTQPEFSAHGIDATAFVNFPNALVTKNDYFVGPATESVENANHCPIFNLPEVEYVMNSVNRLNITAYSPWQDEFNLATRTTKSCSPPSSPTVTLNGTPQTIFTQTEVNVSLGMDVVGGQNLSAWFQLLSGTSEGLTQFTTNVPFAWSAEIGAFPDVLDVGQSASIFMFTPPSLVLCLWWDNGNPAGPGTHPCSWTLTPSAPGVYQIQGIAMASDGTVEGVLPNFLGLPTNTGVFVDVYPDPTVTLTAYSPPTSTVSVSSSTVYSEVKFNASVSGGIPSYKYVWSGLPPPCPDNLDISAVICAPTVTGTYVIQVTVTDSLGFTVSSAPLRFLVTTVCTQCLYTLEFTKVQLLASSFGDSGASVATWSPRLLLVCGGCAVPEEIPPSALSTPPTYVFLVPNGTYEYVLVGPHGEQLSGTASTGNVTVNGAPVSMNVDFRAGPTSTVVFVRSGLPQGSSWCAEFAGVEKCTTGGSISMGNLTPGPYPYLVVPVSGFAERLTENGSPIPTSGWLTVGSGSVHLKLSFVASTYSVTFVETGLAAHTHWSVKVTGWIQGRTRSEVVSSTGSSLVFLLGSGTYSYSVKTVHGYEPVASGEFSVYWSPDEVLIQYLRT